MSTMARRTPFIAGSLALAAVVFCSAVATASPPERVGRLSFLSGSVSFRPATVDDWAAATLNYPMTTGDSLYVHDNEDVVVNGTSVLGGNLITTGVNQYATRTFDVVVTTGHDRRRCDCERH